MLKLNVTAVLKARGIQKPYSYLVKAGISPNVATRMVNNEPEMVHLNHLEKLCYLLNCEPTDLFTWIPDSKLPMPENHPLQKIRKNDEPNSFDLLNGLSYQQLKALALKINKEKNTGENR